MKIILLVIFAFTLLTGHTTQEPQLPNYLKNPYVDRGDKAKFRPLCNKDWGPTESMSYDNQGADNRSTSEVIIVFFNADHNNKSAEWLLATKTEHGQKTIVRCYLPSGDRFIFQREFEFHEE